MLTIIVAYATPERQIEIPMEVPENCTIFSAITASGILDLFPEIVLDRAEVGIFSQHAQLEDRMKNKDRIEIYRPLLVDPKKARKERALKPDKKRV